MRKLNLHRRRTSNLPNETPPRATDVPRRPATIAYDKYGQAVRVDDKGKPVTRERVSKKERRRRR